MCVLTPAIAIFGQSGPGVAFRRVYDRQRGRLVTSSHPSLPAAATFRPVAAHKEVARCIFMACLMRAGEDLADDAA